MRIVPVASIPNQAFTVTIDNVRWGLALKDARGVMVADVTRDDIRLLSATRVLAGEAIIPYAYLQTGNFLMLTDQNQLPEWGQLGVSQVLVYLSAAEIAALPQMTVGEIDALTAQVEYLFTDEGFYITTDTGELIENA